MLDEMSVSSTSTDVPAQPTSTSVATPYGSPGVQTPLPSTSANTTNVVLPSCRRPDTFGTASIVFQTRPRALSSLVTAFDDHPIRT